MYVNFFRQVTGPLPLPLEDDTSVEDGLITLRPSKIYQSTPTPPYTFVRVTLQGLCVRLRGLYEVRDVHVFYRYWKKIPSPKIVTLLCN